ANTKHGPVTNFTASFCPGFSFITLIPILLSYFLLRATLASLEKAKLVKHS
ncbi:MAG: hypothetical protein ACI952_001891, partial [Flavobacteriales bacterium]